MKANPDQPAGLRLKAEPPAKLYPKLAKVSSVDPPAQRKTWFSSYDEEWAAFIAANSMRKSHSGISFAEAETIPRVWNIPHS